MPFDAFNKETKITLLGEEIENIIQEINANTKVL
jgi:hypothetical protein